MTEHDKASGFFTEVNLPTVGINLRIRKVNAQVAENAAEGGALLRGLMGESERLDDATLQDAALLIQVSQAANRRMTEQAVKSPKFTDLMSLHESDGTDDDLGMGSDYTVLLNAIREHSGVRAVMPVEKPSAE